MNIAYEDGKVLLYNKVYTITLTKEEYKSFRQQIEKVDLNIWTEEVPFLIKEQVKRDRR